MSDHSNLCLKIKEIMIDELMLDESVEEIDDHMALMGPDSLELDSVDALQLVVAIEKNFGLKVTDPELAKVLLKSVHSIAEGVAQHQAATSE